MYSSYTELYWFVWLGWLGLRSKSLLLLRNRSALLLSRRWVLGGTGYLGGDSFVPDSGGSGIWVDILLVVSAMVLGWGGG